MAEADAKRDAPTPTPTESGWHLGLELPPRQTISQWADAIRQIAQGTGPEPGRWRTDRTPYLRDCMDASCDPDVEITVLRMSSQVGKTEVLLNAALYYIDQDPSPQMLVLPTLEAAASFSTKRFTPTVEATPTLRDRLSQYERTTSNTILEKAYPGGDIVFSGANSPTSLASRPRRVVMMDEIDKYDANIGKDGDPIKQTFQRTQNFWNRKKLLASTPSLEGLSKIDEWFLRSDQRFFECPCHACGAFQALEWEQIRWPKSKPHEARYICTDCDAEWDQRQVHLAVRHGQWVARAAFNGIAGFSVWSIYSPWVSMADLAAEWEDVDGKPTEEQTFVNLKLGRSYNPTKGAKTTPEELMARRAVQGWDYGPSADGSYTVPDDVLLVTAHVDVQADRWECQYVGWGAGDIKFALDLVRHFGDTAVPMNWRAMEAALLLRSFQHPSGHVLQIEAIAIDAGYQQQLVLEFVREGRAGFRPYYAVRGVAGEGKPIIRQSEERFKLGAKLHLVGVDDGKSILFQEIAARPDADIPGSRYRVHFARHLPHDYFEQLVASERLKVEYVGGWPRRKWVKVSGKRNEALDTFVGAMAARYALTIDYEARRAQVSGTVQVKSLGDLAAAFKR